MRGNSAAGGGNVSPLKHGQRAASWEFDHTGLHHQLDPRSAL